MHPGLYGCQRHHASAAGGDGGDASVLDGAIWQRFLDSSAGPAGAHGRGPRARDAGASSSTATMPRWCSTPAAPRATIQPSSGCCSAGDHFITTSIEHSAILQAAERVAEHGVEMTFVAPLPNGLIDPEEIRRAIRPETRLISVMLANNETGVLQPVEEIGKIAADAGVFFHIDAVQGAGKVTFDVRRFGCHLCSISAHKMHGPKGVGAMFRAPRNAGGIADRGRKP